MRETQDYQPHVINKIKKMLPGCLVLKNDPNYIQGIMDLTVLHGNKWATLEVKTSAEKLKKPVPNQKHYIDECDKMSFSSFIYPENEAEVLDKLYRFMKL